MKPFVMMHPKPVPVSAARAKTLRAECARLTDAETLALLTDDAAMGDFLDRVDVLETAKAKTVRG